MTQNMTQLWIHVVFASVISLDAALMPNVATKLSSNCYCTPIAHTALKTSVFLERLGFLSAQIMHLLNMSNPNEHKYWVS